MTHDGTTQWPGAVVGIETLFYKEVASLVFERHLDAFPVDPFDDLGDLRLQNLDEFRPAEGSEDDDVVGAVEKLRTEAAPGLPSRALPSTWRQI